MPGWEAQAKAVWVEGKNKFPLFYEAAWLHDFPRFFSILRLEDVETPTRANVTGELKWLENHNMSVRKSFGSNVVQLSYLTDEETVLQRWTNLHKIQSSGTSHCSFHFIIVTQDKTALSTEYQANLEKKLLLMNLHNYFPSLTHSTQKYIKAMLRVNILINTADKAPCCLK